LVVLRSRLVDAGFSLFAIRQTYLTVLSRSFFHKSNMIPIAWYLLHEDCQNGHLAISRLDRFTEHFKLLDSKGRDSTEQWQSLQVAHQLLENGWGLYLGKQEEQSLSHSR
ncbi:MAG: hypothetical protein ACYTX0_42585, partial [Nostoc sp.]